MQFINAKIFRKFSITRKYLTLLESQSSKRLQNFLSIKAYNNNKSFTTNIFESKIAFGVIMVNRKVSSITLYKTDQSPPARAVMIIIDLLGLDVNMEDLNPLSREQDEPPFLKMNPMKTIPILDEGDFSLGDSHAIMIYLIEKYGKPEHNNLYPKDERRRAIINHVLFFECGILFPRLRAIMAPTYMGKLTELTKYMKINLEDAYDMIETFLTERKFVAGDVLTIADFSVFTTTQSLDTVHPVDEKKCPKLKQWLKMMSGLEVVRRVSDPWGGLHGQTLLRLMQMNKENQQSKAKL